MQGQTSTLTQCNATRKRNAQTFEAFIASVIDAIRARDHDLGLFAYLAETEALAAARALDAHHKSFQSLPLAGIPIAVKDIIDVAGMPTTFGCAAPIGYYAKQDASIVRRLKAQGAIVVGKSVTTELAFLEPACTLNPRGETFTPGGSSAGSAAVVSAGLLPLAIGAQTGGSVIRPAAFCGVSAIKPTFGLLDRFGVLSQSPSLDTLGFMANDLDDLALAMTACAPLAPAQPKPDALKVALLNSDLVNTAEDYMLALMDQLSDEFCETSCRIFQDHGLASCVEVRNQINDYELHHQFNSLCRDHSSTLSNHIKQAHQRGAQISTETYFSALTDAARLRETFAKLLIEYDCLIMPSTLGEPPKGLSSTGSSVFNGPWTLLGFPVVHLPLSTGPNGMPIGLQVIGAPYTDLNLLQSAKTIRTRLRV
jgi:Asp-tRNA(Asn)/Glu-tRNA(Gln) amidotransferase A subunit family amidase